MEQGLERKKTIAQLQQEILAMQHVAIDRADNRLGLGAIEQAFPNHISPRAGVHELSSYNREGIAATNGFLSGLLSKLIATDGYCLWIGHSPKIYAPALNQFRIEAEHIIFVRTLKDKETLWVMEEALKCASLSAVIGEVSQLSFKESRRLQLAVEESKVTGFIHRHFPAQTNTIACVSRWHIQPSISLNPEHLPGVGAACWEVNLLKVRNGQAGKWTVAWKAGQFNIINKRTALAATASQIKRYG